MYHISKSAQIKVWQYEKCIVKWCQSSKENLILWKLKCNYNNWTAFITSGVSDSIRAKPGAILAGYTWMRSNSSVHVVIAEDYFNTLYIN